MADERSYSELMLEDLMTEFRTISAANGYRNDVKKVTAKFKDPKEVPDFPEVSILLGNGTLEPKDANRTIYDSFESVNILGYVSADTDTDDDANLSLAAESLLHDMKRVLAAIFIKYVNTTTHCWVVDRQNNTVKVMRLLDFKANKGIVALQFTPKLLNQGVTFKP